MGKHLLNDFKKRKGSKHSKKHSFLQAVMAVSSPKIEAKDEAEFEFEEGLTSKPLLDLKRSNRHIQTNEFLERDPLLIVPRNQIQRIPGMINNDTCNFEIFMDTIKSHRSIKKDLSMFLKTR